ncbi:UNVERIFIED_CONTAM: hypothetical protein FKN15_010205 [Acipenser sinensis]
MKKELQNLDSSMVTAILYHILDSFTQTKEPLQELVKAAEQSSNVHGVNQLDQLQPFLHAFLIHADRMIQVAGFVSASASNIKNIQAIESSMKCLKRLKDNVVPILLDLNKNSHQSTALERLAVLFQQWESETQQLLGALDDVINIYEFTDLSIEEIEDDKAKCEKAFKAQSVEHFYEHTSNLIGHVNIIVQAAKRHVDKSDDPIFRNGLLVLVKQVESAIPPTAQPFATSLAWLNHAVTMPSSKHLNQKLLPQCTSGVQDQLRSQMQQAQNIYLTIALWSSRDKKSKICIMGHFIVNYTLKTVMLACLRFRGMHTAENIYGTYEETIEVYNMADKVSGIVTDNAANMVKAFTIFPPLDVQDGAEDQDEAVGIDVVSVSDKLNYFPPECSPCFAHTLQLVVRDALEQAGPLRQVMAKVSRIVSNCHKYTKATELLEGHYKLQISNATRWNNQLKMLRSMLKVPAEILSELHAPYKLKIIAELCEILEPFEEVTEKVQGGQ